MHRLFFGIILVCSLVQSALSANILGFFPIPSRSHQIVYQIYMKELAKQGHTVTVVTLMPHSENVTNYTEIDVSYTYDYLTSVGDPSTSVLVRVSKIAPALVYYKFTEFLDLFCEMYLTDPNIVELIQSNRQFDAFVVEYSHQPCLYPFAKQSNGVMIGILSNGYSGLIHTGSTSNPAYIPDLRAPVDQSMSILEKLWTVINHLLLKFIHLWTKRNQQLIAEKAFGTEIGSLDEIGNNVSLLLQNAHFTTNWVKPQSQIFIDIGGPPVHLTHHSPKQLPKDLQDFLDSASEGAIYFSLGSYTKSSSMSRKAQAIFVNVFRNIKQKVLWKWEIDDMPGKPDNVKISKWLPQADVLAHPNIRAFITQGGFQSTGEATHFVVPMVIMPLHSDQGINAKKIESMGVSITLDYLNLTEEDILRAISEIQTQRYKENMLRYSNLTRDQPLKPLERAVWWTEHILRHKGGQHLRSAAVDMPLYHYFLLDVQAFLSMVLVFVLSIGYFISARLFQLLLLQKVAKHD